jgi:hypothetical protein
MPLQICKLQIHVSSTLANCAQSSLRAASIQNPVQYLCTPATVENAMNIVPGNSLLSCSASTDTMMRGKKVKSDTWTHLLYALELWRIDKHGNFIF